MLSHVDMKNTKVYIIRYYNDQLRYLDVFLQFDRIRDRRETRV